MPSESGSTSPAPPNSTSGTDRNGERRLSTSSYDPTPYVQRARVTRPAPPKPSVNPMQFVQIKPCSLYQSAQQQAKRAEEVKKVKEIKKEEPEDWQSNLDNWKSSRRKRVEHIIDRVVEVKKLELEEHDRTRRKTKTFSEMLGERGTGRRKLSAIPVYNEDESNDLSDLGIGTSSASASGKSSLSEDYDNHSVMSDNTKTEKPTLNGNNTTNHENGGSNSRDYTSSPCYDTSSSTAPASSPDPCEYTYEGAIEDYKSRISRAQTSNNYNGFRRNTISAASSSYSKDSTPERDLADTYYNRRMSNSKVEDRLSSFEIKTASDQVLESSVPKKDLPKVDILKRRELFEKDNSTSASATSATTDYSNQKRYSCDFTNNKSIKDRFSTVSSEKKNDDIIINNKNINRLSGDITSIKDRLQNLKQKQTSSVNDKATPKIVDVPVVVSLKDRLTSLHSAAKKEEIKKPVVLIDEHQLEILKKEELEKRNALKRECFEDESISSSQELLNLHYESNVDTDREDSGIHTTDVSCSVSQTDEQPEIVNEETHHHHHLQHINEDNLHLNNVTTKHDNEQHIDEIIVEQIPDVIQHSHTNKFDNIISNNDIISERKELIVQQTDDLISDQDTSVSLLVDDIKTTDNSSKNIIIKKSSLSNVDAPLGDASSIIAQSMVVVGDKLSSTSQKILDTNNVKLTSSIAHNNTTSNTNHCNNLSRENFFNGDNTYNDRYLVFDSKIHGSPSKIVNGRKKIDSIEQNIVEDISKSKISASITKDNLLNNKVNDNSSIVQGNLDIKNNEFINSVSKDDSLVHSDVINSKCKEEFQITEEKNILSNMNFEVEVFNNSCNKINARSVDDYVEQVTLKTPPKSPNNNKDKRKTVYEICEKKNVKDLPKPTCIPTPFYNIDLIPDDIDNDIKINSKHSVSSTKPSQSVSNDKPLVECIPKPTASTSRPSSPKNGIIIAKLEVIETKIKVTSNETPPVTPISPLPQSPKSPKSPKINPKTHPSSKPKNIFDFLKKNFNTDNNAEDDSELDIGAVSVDNSKFYVPLTDEKPSNEVNIEITRTVKTEKIVEPTDSTSSEISMTTEINQLLDEEMSKLTTKDTKL